MCVCCRKLGIQHHEGAELCYCTLASHTFVLASVFVSCGPIIIIRFYCLSGRLSTKWLCREQSRELIEGERKQIFLLLQKRIYQ